MNVLQLCTKVPFPARDGGSLATIAFTKLLLSRNFHVALLAANTPKHHVKVPADSVLKGLKLFSVQVDTDVHLSSLVQNWLFSAEPYNIKRFYNQDFEKQLIDILSHESYDIVQLEGPHLGIYLPVIRKYSSAGVVLRAHNVEHRLWEELAREKHSILKKRYFILLSRRVKEFERTLISQVDGVIPISKLDQYHISCFSSPKLQLVVPFKIELDQYAPDAKVNNKTIFFIGALDWMPNQKGLVWFLDNVWPLLRSRISGLSFHVAGRNAPQWLVNKLSMGNISYYGEVPDGIKFIRDHQVMVVPLFSGSGVRIKILEAMALKKLIVTTSKGAEGIDVSDGNELMLANDAETFCSKILCLLNNVNLQNAMVESARSYVYNGSDNTAKEVEEFYHRIKQGISDNDFKDKTLIKSQF